VRRRVRGIVQSGKMDKTVSVSVERLIKHSQYEKYVRRNSILKAHDAQNHAKPGDLVEIEESRPLSKTKHWRLVRILRRALAPADKAAAEPAEEGVQAQ